jgi:hypothetical protein
MFGRFRSLYHSCGLLLLGLYCHGVLAVGEAVNEAGTSPIAPALPVPPGTPSAAPNPTPGVLPTNPGNLNEMEGGLMMVGSMLMMIALAWLVIVALGRIVGSKALFKKPLILGLVGIALIYASRHLVK